MDVEQDDSHLPTQSGAAHAAQLMEDWLENQTSLQTQRAYRRDFELFWVFAQQQGVTSIDEVKRQHVLAWRNAMHAEGRSNATIMRRLASVSEFFKEAVMAGYLEGNPASPEAVKRPKVSAESPRHALENKDVREILTQPDRTTAIGVRDYAILSLLVFMGLRREEVAALNIGSFAQERGHTVLPVKGKGERVRLLPVAPRVKLAVDAMLEAMERADDPPDAPLFIATHNNKYGKAFGRLSSDSIWRIVKKYAVRAGIAEEAIMPHVLRHTAITNALDNGAPLRRVQYFAGHTKPETTMRYDSRRGDLDDSAAWKVSYDN